MSLAISITTSDKATPLLKQLDGLRDDRKRLNQRIADRAAVPTRNHLSALNKHSTAQRLGATPTDYFAKKADSVEASATGEAATVSIATGGGAEAFARVNGPVTITARNAKYLTIPATAAAYGRRAREFGDLKFVPFGNGTRALMKDGVVFYWLKPSVEIPQDRSILPSDEEYLNAAESGADDYLNEITREAAAA